MSKNFFFLLPLLILLGCNHSKKEETNLKLEITQTTPDTKIVNSLGETLSPESRKLVENWPEYITLDEIMSDYYTITNDEALRKAKDLSNYTQYLRDSIRIDDLDRPDVKIRLNVLHNISLRLADMETIKTIKPEEITLEVTNILNAFSAVNSKINNILVQKNLENELVGFENN